MNLCNAFKVLLLDQNNPTAVWLTLVGMHNKKKHDFWK